MDEVRETLTVYFEEPFWIGVFEREENGRLCACKVTFGAEPKDYEVYAYVLRYFSGLKYGPTVESAARVTAKNPKRLQREAKRQLTDVGIGTKAQQALAAQREQNKQERKAKSREEKLAEAERMFALKQRKKKEKHRGR